MQVFQDPARVNLRKAVRAAVVVPALFAVMVVTGNTQSALFGAFGAFAALVFADFGGALRRRFRAYVLLAALGGCLAALGTAFADTLYPAAIVTLVATFTITFSGALGGYFAAGGTAATLAFVLAVMTPGVEADLVAREIGWVVGVVVAGVSAVALWPVHQRDRVRSAAVTLLEAAADCLVQPAETRDLGPARAAGDTMAARAGVVYRPAGSITRERALTTVVVAARRIVPLLELLTRAEASADADTSIEYTDLAAAVASMLQSSAQALAGVRDVTLDVDTLRAKRDAHTAALERWAASTVRPDDVARATRVIDRITAAFPLRRFSLAAVQIATDVQAAANDTVRSASDGIATASRAWATLRAHCTPTSVRFRNAARTGLGLALAVLVAKTASVDHAFWVVLGALAVLRSNALGTGATALQALLGALVGFGVASAVMLTISGDEQVLWVLLPVVVFLAGYTPGAVNFVVGQAAFTVFVVVMFNVLIPEGWRTGLVRVQDVAIGAGISVAIGALLWPRGARGVARRSFAELLRAGVAHVRVALDAALDHSDVDVTSAARRAADARDRAVAALEDLAVEHGGGHVDRQAWNGLLVDALVLQLAAEGILRGTSGFDRSSACTATVSDLEAEGQVLSASVNEEADRLLTHGVLEVADEPGRHLLPPSSLAACVSAHTPTGIHDAVGLVWVHEWIALAAERTRADPRARGARSQR